MTKHVTLSRPAAHPAMQERSKATLERLLDAAEDILRSEGIEGATVELIAARAGVSVGVVYRRFPDKDALFRATYMRFFENRARSNAESLAAEHWQGKNVEEIIEAFVAGAVAGAARERRLVASLNRFAALHDDPGFRSYATQLNRQTHQMLVDLLLRAPDISRRGAARKRVEFAVDLLLTALRGFLIDETAPSGATYPKDVLVSELTTLMESYLPRR